MKVNGPNPELRKGTDPSRVQGSQGAVGRDIALACGPQSQHQRSHWSTPGVPMTAV